MLVLRDSVQMRVRNREVGEDVGRAQLDIDNVEEERGRNGPLEDVEEEVGRENVTQAHPAKLDVVLRAQRVPRVEVQLPKQGDQQADQRAEEVHLVIQPQLCPIRDFPLSPDQLLPRFRLRHRACVKRHQWQGIQIHVVPHLLRRRVVLVVLVTPPRGRHSAAQAVEELLQELVQFHLPGQRVMPALVLEPPAASLRDAQNNQPSEHAHILADGQQPEPDRVHRYDFEHAVERVRG
mmetsp:Transcript_18635/g.46523  ORF Transcript_18635/g.46523 Transcript_18635/m.46523 type:complete len:236 (+) Transcript_18635:1005-1712(+)